VVNGTWHIGAVYIQLTVAAATGFMPLDGSGSAGRSFTATRRTTVVTSSGTRMTSTSIYVTPLSIQRRQVLRFRRVPVITWHPVDSYVRKLLETDKWNLRVATFVDRNTLTTNELHLYKCGWRDVTWLLFGMCVCVCVCVVCLLAYWKPICVTCAVCFGWLLSVINSLGLHDNGQHWPFIRTERWTILNILLAASANGSE